ncbi:hypothetical protein [Rhizobium sp. SAFR-030]|uniref:hypothetical protein n=1 Tax=Rhizobium sp. SAFR-030 TaxID=3387277 RepID=UPI003F7FF943
MSVKTFEALDIMRFATPNVFDIDVMQTASNPEFLAYLGGRGWGSYRPVWTRMPRIWRAPLSDEEITSWWKTAWLIDGMKSLRDQYKAEGRWYPVSQDPRTVGGLRVKTSIRGILFTKDFGAELHVINPRKSQRVDVRHLGFLARAAYEELGVDDPNSPTVAVLDMGSKKRNKLRDMTMYRGDVIEMMDANHFLHAVNSFMDALKIASSVTYGDLRRVSASDFRVIG